LATKTADKKKSAAAKSAHVDVEAPKPGALEVLATEYLMARIHQHLVAYGEPARLGDIAQALSDDGVTVNLARYGLSQHPSRFVQIDRRWDVRTRYLDQQRPVSRLLEEVVSNYDAPIAAFDAAHELGMIINRSAEGTRPMVERLLKSSGTYAPMIHGASDVKYGLSSWLLDVRDEYVGDANVLFYNFLPADALEPFAGVEADWIADKAAAAAKILAAAPGSPRLIDNRLLLFFAWKQLQEDFDAAEIFSALSESEALVLLPGHRWTDQAGLSAIRGAIATLAETAESLPEEEEIEVVETAPLSVSAADLDEMFRIVSQSDVAISAARLLEEVYDSAPGERTYNSDLQIVTDALRGSRHRFQWVGYDRFRSAGSLPPYIGQVPESLQFPVVPQIPDPEEDLLDQLIEDEGFERGLERDIRNAVAMDVGDQDPPETAIWPSGETGSSRSIRLVLKAHHKEIGTFPLCQIPKGFLPTEPDIIELSLRDARGGEFQVFADQETQLIYGIGLFDLYSSIPTESGAIFHIEKTATAGELRFVTSSETDSDYYVSPERLEQLQNYRAELEAGPTVSTHEIVRYILEHSNQAMTYINLLAEVNIVRRTSRRQLASILSAWTAFSQKGGLWSYDAKKAAAGFNKTKRKYII
jgi:hypothetical protein